jgi:hypothetical protein
MAITSSGFVRQADIDREVKKSVERLSSQDVVRVRYSLGLDSTDEPSIYFRIVLTDQASQAEDLADVSGRVAGTIYEELQPHEHWGLNPYFSFRSKSEQDELREPEWA